MALVTVYDPSGVAHEKEPVDAKELCLENGWSMFDPAAKPTPPAVIDPTKLKKDELVAWLTENGIACDSTSKMDDLRLLIPKAE